MGVDVTIRKKGLFSGGIDVDDLWDVMEENDYFLIATSDFIADFAEEDWEYDGESLIIYNDKEIGRGFEISFEKRKVELRLPFLCTKKDIELFYKYIKIVCEKIVDVDVFEQDGTIYNLGELAELRKSIEDVNLEYMNDMLRKDGESTVIFACLFPIHIEQDFLRKTSELNIAEFNLKYAQYLNEKQQSDVYYARRIMVEFDNDKLYGIYAIGEGIRTVIPSEEVGYLQEVDQEYVSVGKAIEETDDYEGFEVRMEDFKKVINYADCPKFDEIMIQVKLTKEDVDRLSRYRCELGE